MAVQRYKAALNNARFPLVSTWGERAVILPAIDASQRSPRQYQGSDENIDFNVPQVLYGENFVPVSAGIKSVSYKQIIGPTVNRDFDQIFPLRDADENTVLYSPSHGQNYVYDSVAEAWSFESCADKYLDAGYYVSSASISTPETAKVTRAYVEGKTFVCYGNIGLRTGSSSGPITADGSLFYWDPLTESLQTVRDLTYATLIKNLDRLDRYGNRVLPDGDIGGIASSNGYLLIWSGLTVHWALWDGASFDFIEYAAGEVTGAGYQIPEDVKGPITALVPVTGGFIIFTTKNAVAAFYNANNFASPWIFRQISNAGGIESYEQTTEDANLGAIYAHTTGGLQRITLNAAETSFPDVTDFLGLRLQETFNPSSLQFERGLVTADFFTKLSFCGQRFLVISYGTYPGIYSYALVYDAELKRWGKLRLAHRDCFAYSYGSQEAPLTYAMLGDVPYEDMDTIAYEDAIIAGGNLTYPRQSVAFLLETGEIKLAVMDTREPEDDSQAFVLLGRFQLTRSRLSTLHEVEIEGLVAGGTVGVLRSTNGRTFASSELGYLREQSEDFAEYGFDMVTGKNFTLFVKGNFYLSSAILHVTNDGSY